MTIGHALLCSKTDTRVSASSLGGLRTSGVYGSNSRVVFRRTPKGRHSTSTSGRMREVGSFRGLPRLRLVVLRSSVRRVRSLAFLAGWPTAGGTLGIRRSSSRGSPGHWSTWTATFRRSSRSSMLVPRVALCSSIWLMPLGATAPPKRRSSRLDRCRQSYSPFWWGWGRCSESIAGRNGQAVPCDAPGPLWHLPEMPKRHGAR